MSKISDWLANRLMTPNGRALRASLSVGTNWRLNGTNVISLDNKARMDLEIWVIDILALKVSHWYGTGQVKLSWIDWAFLQKPAISLQKALKRKKDPTYQNDTFISICTTSTLNGDIK